MRLLILGILMGFPLLEGALLYTLGQGHGGWVIAWLLFSAIAGIVLIKQARFSLITRLAGELSRGQFSLTAIIDSFRTVVAGLLLNPHNFVEQSLQIEFRVVRLQRFAGLDSRRV